jgi:filamin
VGEIVPESVVGDSVEFTVDAGRAGFGNLELAIKNADGIIIPSHVRIHFLEPIFKILLQVSQLESGTAKFLVTFNPSSLGVHSVNITFNKEIIKGSPFEVRVVDTPSNVVFTEGVGT